MVGENFEIYSSPLAKNTLKFPTMVGVNIGIYSSHHLDKNALKLSNMVGENFTIYSSQLVINTLKLSTMVGEILEFTHLN